MKKVSQQSKIKYIQLHANRLDIDKVYEHIVKDREMNIFEQDVFKPVWYKEEGYRIDFDNTSSPIYTIMRQLGWDAPTALIHKVLKEFVAQNLVTASHGGKWSMRQLYYLLITPNRRLWRYPTTKENTLHYSGSAWSVSREFTDLCYAMGIITDEEAKALIESYGLHFFEVAMKEASVFTGIGNLRMKFFLTKDDILLSKTSPKGADDVDYICHFLDKVGGVYNNNTVFRLPSFVDRNADEHTLSKEKYYKSKYFNR